MSIINVTVKGSWDSTEEYLRVLSDFNSRIKPILEKYGPMGVNALAEATPQDSGLASESWYYEIVERSGYISLRWHNNDIENGVSVVILLQYGHGTRNGGWVEGRDYIMPAINPIFDQIMNEVEEVIK